MPAQTCESRFSHLTVLVLGQARMAAFYRDALGFEPFHAGILPRDFNVIHGFGAEQDVGFAILKRDDFLFELIEAPPEARASVAPPGRAILGLRVPSVDAAMAAIAAAGGEVLHDTHIANTTAEVVVCRDPEGNRFEIMRDAPPQEPPAD